MLNSSKSWAFNTSKFVYNLFIFDPNEDFEEFIPSGQ